MGGGGRGDALPVLKITGSLSPWKVCPSHFLSFAAMSPMPVGVPPFPSPMLSGVQLLSGSMSRMKAFSRGSMRGSASTVLGPRHCSCCCAMIPRAPAGELRAATTREGVRKRGFGEEGLGSSTNLVSQAARSVGVKEGREILGRRYLEPKWIRIATAQL